MQSVGSLKSAFSGNVQAFQVRAPQGAPKRGQLQVSRAASSNSNIDEAT